MGFGTLTLKLYTSKYSDDFQIPVQLSHSQFSYSRGKIVINIVNDLPIVIYS